MSFLLSSVEGQEAQLNVSNGDEPSSGGDEWPVLTVDGGNAGDSFVTYT